MQLNLGELDTDNNTWSPY